MTEQEREELIENIVTALIRARLNGFNTENTARAALAVAEPVIRDKCAKIIEPSFPRPCDCETCYCGNRDDAERVAAWDEATANAKAIREGGKGDGKNN